jgi:arylsulfatase A-like enzyme
LILFNSENGDESRAELYNIARDPNEEHDLAESQSDKLSELRKKLEAAAVNDRDAVAPNE